MEVHSADSLESDESLKNELRSIQRLPLLSESLWHCASTSFTYTTDRQFKYHFLQKLFDKFCRFYGILFGKTRKAPLIINLHVESKANQGKHECCFIYLYHYSGIQVLQALQNNIP